MGEFFKPWRRKIGVLALAVVCSFVAAWVRSNSNEDHEDVLRFRINKQQTIALKSRNGTISGIHFDRPEVATGFGSAVVSDNFGPSESTAELSESKHNWCGIIFGEERDPYDRTRIRFCNIPYGMILVPLTLLSAHLLLSKPRHKTPPGTERAVDPPAST